MKDRLIHFYFGLEYFAPLLQRNIKDWDLYVFRQNGSNNVLLGAPAIPLG